MTTTTSVTPGFDNDLARTGAASTRATRVTTVTPTRVRAFRLLIVFGLAFGVVGAVLLSAGNYTHRVIRDQLEAQQIQFPPAGSPVMTAEEFPGLQQYGGPMVDSGPKAKAWAEQFMTPHILQLSGGLPYGVYSAQAFQNPQDKQMADTSKLMAIGEVQRGLLLSAWGWWTVGTVTWTAGFVLIVLAGLVLVTGAIVRIRWSRGAAG
jgi:hypothetical protein